MLSLKMIEAFVSHPVWLGVVRMDLPPWTERTTSSSSSSSKPLFFFVLLAIQKRSSKKPWGQLFLWHSWIMAPPAVKIGFWVRNSLLLLLQLWALRPIINVYRKEVWSQGRTGESQKKWGRKALFCAKIALTLLSNEKPFWIKLPI